MCINGSCHVCACIYAAANACAPSMCRIGLNPPASLTQSQTSQFIWDVGAIIGSRQSPLFFTDCWQQPSSVWVDVSVLPACQYLSIACMHVCLPWKPLNSTLVVSLVSLDSLRPSAHPGVMTGTSNSAFDSFVSSLESSTTSPHAHIASSQRVVYS